MDDKVIFERGDQGDRRRQWCRCVDCGEVSVCTRSNDFYTRDAEKKGPLCCKMCLLTTH